MTVGLLLGGFIIEIELKAAHEVIKTMNHWRHSITWGPDRFFY